MKPSENENAKPANQVRREAILRDLGKILRWINEKKDQEKHYDDAMRYIINSKREKEPKPWKITPWAHMKCDPLPSLPQDYEWIDSFCNYIREVVK